MKTILLSGFGNFGAYNANSTEILFQHIQSQKGEIAGYQAQTVVFDCCIPTHDRGQILFELSARKKCSGIISLGMASEAQGLRLETAAYNLIDSKYCPAELNGTTIDRTHMPGNMLNMDLKPWNIDAFFHGCVQARVRTTKLSFNPGGFCGNHLMYQVRTLQLRQRDCSGIPFIFIHIPCSPEAVGNACEHVLAGKILMRPDEVMQGLGLLLQNANLP